MMSADRTGEDLSSERVLVTGGAGVIAREVLDLLSARGASVLSVDRRPLSFEPAAGVEHLIADLATADLGPIAEFRPGLILHLAATFERSVESAEFWEQNWSDNVVVTHRLAELAARLGGVRGFVFASSYLVYKPSQYLSAKPPDDGVPLAEDAEMGPRNLCGAAKLYGEAEIEFVRARMGGAYRAVTARIFRVYGRGSKDIVSRWVRAALRDEPIEVYHAENLFDYVFSRDVAEGLVRIALDPRVSGAMNLATGIGRTVAEVLAAIGAATGHRLRTTMVSADEPYEGSRADIALLRERLDWSPSTDLMTGVSLLVDYERSADA
jgi:nucleoside-diphosphate-sugar epimerase